MVRKKKSLKPVKKIRRADVDLCHIHNQALRSFMANNVTVQVQGLKVKNSPVQFDTCRGVLVSGLSISSPTLCPHTDGIHVENAQDVLISNTAVSNSDDCVSPSAPAPSTCTLRTSPPCGPGGRPRHEHREPGQAGHAGVRG